MLLQLHNKAAVEGKGQCFGKMMAGQNVGVFTVDTKKKFSPALNYLLKLNKNYLLFHSYTFKKH